MNFKYSFIILLQVVLSMAACEKPSGETLQKEVEEEIIDPNSPEFSWDTMPLYMHVRKNTAFNSDEIEYLSEFPLITLEKSTGYTTYGSNENGTLEAAKAIKAINSKTTILYYKNVVINWGNYEEDERFLSEHPEAFLTNGDGEKAFMPNGTSGFFDISQENVRDYWLDHVRKISENIYIDGVFLDANIKVLVPSFFGNKVGDVKQQEVEDGYFTMMKDLNTQIGDDNLLLANIIRVRPEFKDVGREYLKYFDGSYLEGFDHESFGMTYAEYLSKGIEAFQKSAQEGNIIAMSIGLGEGLEGAVKGMDDIRQSVNLNDNIKERLDYVLAIFLVCAEKYSYVYPHDGYNSKTSAVWLKSFTQYENKLGAPKGSAVKTGYTYKRSFEHLDVTLDIENKTAKLDWK